MTSGVGFIGFRDIGNRRLCVADGPVRVVEAGSCRGRVGGDADAPVFVEANRRTDAGTVKKYGGGDKGRLRRLRCRLGFGGMPGGSGGRRACGLRCNLSEKRDCAAGKGTPSCPDSRPQFSSHVLAYSMYSSKVKGNVDRDRPQGLV